MVVGITGGIGSGKSTVAQLFAAYPNVVVYTADEEAKKLMNTSTIISQKIINAFGKNAYKNNELQRDFLAKIVFQNPDKLAILNAIVHPEVRKHFQEFVKKHSKNNLIFYENAILFETKSNLFCDKIITVFASQNTRIKRVMQRDATTKETVLKRIHHQYSDEVKLLQSHYVIFNHILNDTQNQVKEIYNILTKNC